MKAFSEDKSYLSKVVYSSDDKTEVVNFFDNHLDKHTTTVGRCLTDESASKDQWQVIDNVILRSVSRERPSMMLACYPKPLEKISTEAILNLRKIYVDPHLMVTPKTIDGEKCIHSDNSAINKAVKNLKNGCIIVHNDTHQAYQNECCENCICYSRLKYISPSKFMKLFEGDIDKLPKSICTAIASAIGGQCVKKEDAETLYSWFKNKKINGNVLLKNRFVPFTADQLMDIINDIIAIIFKDHTVSKYNNNLGIINKLVKNQYKAICAEHIIRLKDVNDEFIDKCIIDNKKLFLNNINNYNPETQLLILGILNGHH